MRGNTPMLVSTKTQKITTIRISEFNLIKIIQAEVLKQTGVEVPISIIKFNSDSGNISVEIEVIQQHD